MATSESGFDPSRDLRVVRLFDAPCTSLWRAWTEAEWLKQWFVPAPWQMPRCSIDLKPGGALRWTMRSPEGGESEHEACYLEMVENERLVWTDALGEGFRPLAQPFITVRIELQPEGERTRQTCTVLHKDEATRGVHLDKGFEQGWNACLDQLANLLREQLSQAT